jgi:hypothetical protein
MFLASARRLDLREVSTVTVRPLALCDRTRLVSSRNCTYAPLFRWKDVGSLVKRFPTLQKITHQGVKRWLDERSAAQVPQALASA